MFIKEQYDLFLQQNYPKIHIHHKDSVVIILQKKNPTNFQFPEMKKMEFLTNVQKQNNINPKPEKSQQMKLTQKTTSNSHKIRYPNIDSLVIIFQTKNPQTTYSQRSKDRTFNQKFRSK